VTWSSSLAGVIGTGSSIVTTGLGAGTHTLSATVTDADGHSGRAEITLIERSPNTPPQVTITAPVAGTSVPAGKPGTLTATVADDFDKALSVRWSSNVQGPLGTGNSMTLPFVEGSHTLSATATDSDGSTSTATVVLTVTPTPPTVVIVAPTPNTTVFA